MTDQISDKLIYEGKEVPVETSLPLVSWFSPEIPESDPRIVESKEGYLHSSACIRGYVATWEIKDNKLFLVKLSGKYRLIHDESIFADWVSDKFIVPKGKLIKGLIKESDSFTNFEEELHIIIEKGVVTKLDIIKNESKTPELVGPSRYAHVVLKRDRKKLLNIGEEESVSLPMAPKLKNESLWGVGKPWATFVSILILVFYISKITMFRLIEISLLPEGGVWSLDVPKWIFLILDAPIEIFAWAIFLYLLVIAVTAERAIVGWTFTVVFTILLVLLVGFNKFDSLYCVLYEWGYACTR